VPIEEGKYIYHCVLKS